LIPRTSPDQSAKGSPSRLSNTRRLLIIQTPPYIVLANDIHSPDVLELAREGPSKATQAEQVRTITAPDFPFPYISPSHSRVRIDDEIFEHTSREFPELTTEPYEKLRKLDEDWMKSADGKKRWRKFIEA
jgi:hypothetical protein